VLSVKTHHEQRQATRGAGRLPGLLVGPGPSVNGPGFGTQPGLRKLLLSPSARFHPRVVPYYFPSWSQSRCRCLPSVPPLREVECGRRHLGNTSRIYLESTSMCLLSVKTHRRAATCNTSSQEAPGTAGGPRSLGQRPRIRHTTWRLGLLGMPPDLVPDQKGVDVISVSFLHAQTHSNVSPRRNRLIG
jgi:hypothetical protein